MIFLIRLDDERSYIPVIIATDKHGKKELLALSDGYRESAICWKEMLLHLKRRGLDIGPRLAVGDGAMGFWKALRKVICRQKNNDVGFIRPLISWINCRKACNPKPRSI